MARERRYDDLLVKDGEIPILIESYDILNRNTPISYYHNIHTAEVQTVEVIE
jgi:hypothetical protein